MDLGELHGAGVGAEAPTSAGRALDAFRSGLDELVRVVADGGLEGLDDPGLVGFMQGFEQARNRLRLVDHGIIGARPTTKAQRTGALLSLGSVRLDV